MARTIGTEVGKKPSTRIILMTFNEDEEEDDEAGEEDSIDERDAEVA